MDVQPFSVNPVVDDRRQGAPTTGTRHGPLAGSPWPLVGVLALGAFTTSTNTTVLSPLLDPIRAEFGMPTAAVGQLATTTALFAGTTALVAAPWLDRRSRGFWLRLECLLLAAGVLLSALAPSLRWLFIGRAVAGIGGAFVFGICLAAVADLFDDDRRRNLAVGIVGTAATLGAVAGLPAVTGIEHAFGWRRALSITALLAILLFAGSLALPPARAAASAAPDWLARCRRLLTNPAGVRVQAANAALSAAWFGAMIYLGSYAREAFGFGTAALALLYLASGAGEVAGNLATPFLLGRFSSSAVAIGLGLGLAISLILTGWTADWRLLYPLVTLTGLTGAGLFTTVAVRLLDADPTLRGAAMAISSAGFEAGGAVGTAMAGIVLASAGRFGPAYAVLALAPVVVATLLGPWRAKEDATMREATVRLGSDVARSER